MAVTREIALRQKAERLMDDYVALAQDMTSDPDSVFAAYMRQARAAERADTFEALAAHENPMTYQNPVCRGSYALGSACKTCEKCLAELEAMRGFGTLPDKDPSGDDTFLRPKTYTQTLPVAGYKNEQPAWVIDMVNQNKILEEILMRQIDAIKAKGQDVDQCQVALARTKLEEAAYHMNRALYQPQRLEGALQFDFIAKLIS